uniref:Membrane protein MbpA n=1 Tax=Staphylococcus phage 184DA TaxID=3110532 RepID=A0AAU6MXV1_9CAUD
MNKTFFKLLGKNTLEYSKQGLGFLVAFPIMLIIFSIFLAFIIGIPVIIIYALHVLNVDNDFIIQSVPVMWFIILYGIVRTKEHKKPFVKIRLKDYLLSILYLTTITAISVLESYLLFQLLPFTGDVIAVIALLSFLVFVAVNRGICKIAIKSYKEYKEEL